MTFWEVENVPQEGGGLGGEIIAEGTPEKVAKVKGTGHFLKMELNG